MLTDYQNGDYNGFGYRIGNRKGAVMESIKWNVRALAANEKLSVEALAEKCDIPAQHLKDVSTGRVKMTADDLIKLSITTGVSPFAIKTS